jgi:Uma2 family endonuclease
VPTLPKSYLTPEKYLELERKAEFKSEYYAGEMFAMSRAREGHNLIAGNVLGELRQQLLPRRCRVYTSDMRVQVSATGMYTYPDVTALCGEPQLLDKEMDTLLNPTVIVEVLSPSTEAYDRGRKFDHYRTIESLQHYVLVSSDRAHIDVFTRHSDGQWILTSADGLESSIELDSIACRLALSGVYALVELPPKATSVPQAG